LCNVFVLLLVSPVMSSNELELHGTFKHFWPALGDPLAVPVRSKLEESFIFKRDGSVHCEDEDDNGNIRYKKDVKVYYV